jgi:uncharacterized membrane protein
MIAIVVGGGGGGDTAATWTYTHAYDDKNLDLKGLINKAILNKERIKVKIGNETHYIGLIALTSTKATINVSSTPQQAVFSVGETKKFDINNDSYYDLFVVLNKINNSKADISIGYLHEKMIVQLNGTSGNQTLVNGTNLTGVPGILSGNSDTIIIIIAAIICIIIIIIVMVFIYLRKNPEAAYKDKVNVKKFGPEEVVKENKLPEKGKTIIKKPGSK